MKVILKNRKNEVKPFMDEVFILVGKVVLFTGAFFSFFYVVGLLYTLMNPVINTLFEFTMDNIVVTCIVLFVVMLISGIVSVRYESLVSYKDKIIQKRYKEKMSKRKLNIYNLKESTEKAV